MNKSLKTVPMYIRDCNVCAYKYKAQAYYSRIWNKSNSTLNSIEFNWCMILSYLWSTTATASSLAFKTLSPTAYNQLWTLLLVWSLAVTGMTNSHNSFEARFTSFESLNGSPLSETSSPTKSWMTFSALNTSSHSSQDLPQTNYRFPISFSQLCSSSSTTVLVLPKVDFGERSASRGIHILWNTHNLTPQWKQTLLFCSNDSKDSFLQYLISEAC